MDERDNQIIAEAFEKWWAERYASGFRYGAGPLATVRFGFESGFAVATEAALKWARNLVRSTSIYEEGRDSRELKASEILRRIERRIDGEKDELGVLAEIPIVLDADKCAHDHFQIYCAVDRIEDLDPVGFYANIRIVCTECKTPFHFIGLPYGLAPTEPRLEVGGLECRMPIGPGRLPIGSFGEVRYEMGRHRK